MTGFCLGCGYCIQHLPLPRCPECGRPFDPSNPSSFSVSPKRVGPRFLRLLTLPAWPFVTAGAILLLVQYWRERLPIAPPFWHNSALKNAWLAVSLLWLSAYAGLPLLARLYQVPRPYRPRHHPGWLAFLLLPVFAISSTLCQWPFATTFFLSRPSLSELVAQSQANFPILDWPAARAGLLPAKAIYSSRDTLIILLDHDAALIHCHSGQLPKRWPARRQTVPLPFADGRWFLATDVLASTNMNLRAFVETETLVEMIAHPDPQPRCLAFLLKSLEEKPARRAAQLYPSIPGAAQYPVESMYMLVPESGPVPLNLQALAHLERSAVPALTAALDAHAFSPRLCLAALGLIGPPAAEAVPHVAAYLTSPDAECRAFAAWTLRQIDSPLCSQFEALAAALDDPDPIVQYNALRALLASSAPADILDRILVRHWRKHALDPRVNIISCFKIQVRSPCAETLNQIASRIVKDGPVAVAITPLLIDGLTDARKAYEAYPGPFELPGWWTASGQTPVTAEVQAAQMLAAIGPDARAAAPALVSLLQYHLRPQAAPAEFDPQLVAGFAANIQALAKIDPGSPDAVAFLLGKLQDSRTSAVTIAPVGPDEAGRLPASLLNQLAVAFAIEKIDPHNAVIRKILLDSLRGPHNSPQSVWAVEVAGEIQLPPEVLLPALHDMIVAGEARPLLAALRCLHKLGDAATPLLPDLQTRLAADHTLDHAITNSETFRWLALSLLADHPDAPATKVILPYLIRHNINGILNIKGSDRLTPAAKALILDFRQRDLTRSFKEHGAFDEISAATRPKDREYWMDQLGPEVGSDRGVPDLTQVRPALERYAQDASLGYYARKSAIQLLGTLGWDPAIETIVRTNLASPDRSIHRATAEALGIFGIHALNLLPDDADESLRELPNLGYRAPSALIVCDAATHSVPIDQLAALLRRCPRAWDSYFSQKYSVVDAIMNATGSDQTRFDLLCSMQNDERYLPPSAIAALQSLHIATPALRSLLRDALYGAPDEPTRQAARRALDALFP